MFAEEGSSALAFGRLIAEACSVMGIEGRIGLFGDLPAGYAHTLITRLRDLGGPAIDTTQPDLLALARMTKEPDEIAAIRRVSTGTVAAMDRVVSLLGSSRLDGADVLAPDGAIISLGTLRRVIHLEFLERGIAEQDAVSIVSQGADAAVPHSRGDDSAAVRPGAPIVIDIFPAEAGGGYYSDFTRTLCVGPAPPPLADLYDDVLAAVTTTTSALRIGGSVRECHELACDVFEARGHPTSRSHPDTEEGFCHFVGHGVGLAIHEEPTLGGLPSNTQKLEPRMVFTIEPGLYYPSRELGVRIEDLYYARPDGTFENLTPAPYQLEVHPAG
jgi:Xaa-Pro aminopeptidase